MINHVSVETLTSDNTLGLVVHQRRYRPSDKIVSLLLDRTSCQKPLHNDLGVIQEGLYDAKLLHPERSVLRP